MRTLIKFDLIRMLLAGSVIVLTGCGGGGGGFDAAGPTVTPPPAAVETPPTTLSGIAAIGVALDGATVEIIDANGNLVDIPDTLTGSNGSYQVTLPAEVELPVIVRITPPNGGKPLLNIVPVPAEGTTEIIANVNPITNLVAATVLGEVDETSAVDLASALASVDTTTIDAVGDEIIAKVMGSNVDYDAFATDPAFVANDGSTGGSAADAILDTIANQAEDSGVSLAEQLSSLAEQEEPAKLLEDPVFQVQLISELVQGGTDSAALETRLADIGAIADAVEGEADVFRAIIESVPVIIEATIASAGEIADNADLLNLAVEAAVQLVASTVEQKTDRFDADASDLVDLLASPSFQATAVEVIATTIVPILAAFVNDADITGVLTGLETVVDNITEEAANVTSGFEFSETSTDVSDLIASFVQEQVAPDELLTREALENIQDGTTDITDIVSSAGDVSQIQEDIQDFAVENPDLVEGSVSDLIEVIPAGTWETSNWDDFKWG